MFRNKIIVIIFLYILFYIAYLLAAWSRVILEKLTGSQLV